LRRQRRAQRRLLLLQTEVDSQLLLCKELEQRELQLLHRQQEMAASQAWHQQRLQESQQVRSLLGL